MRRMVGMARRGVNRTTWLDVLRGLAWPDIGQRTRLDHDPIRYALRDAFPTRKYRAHRERRA
jgi:hypothetical protein